MSSQWTINVNRKIDYWNRIQTDSYMDNQFSTKLQKQFCGARVDSLINCA